MKWLKRRKAPNLNWLEIWITLILQAAGGGWVGVDKIMKIAFLLERVYGGPDGLIRVCFSPGPWSEDVSLALKKLTSLGLIEEREGAYRLTENGKAVVDGYPMNDARFRYPYVSAKFFMDWDLHNLKEYIRVNYPGWA